MIRLSKANITNAEKDAVMGVLDREYLGMGQEVRQFEEQLSDFFGRPSACVVNGTAALHLACQAVGLGSGDEVLVQSLTYVASFQAIAATGARPVACEVDPTTLTLDWRDAARRVTDRTRAVMPVHYASGVGDIDGIYAFARAHQLRVIEDAAQAFGTTHRGQRVGGFGDVACFSFDGIKNITCGEGGCVVTDDHAVLDRVRDARLLGVARDTEARYRGERSWDFDVTAQGWRYHMSNVMASIGSAQLGRFPSFAEARRELSRTYDERLGNHASVRPIARDEGVIPHIYVVRIRGLANRDTLRQRLLSAGIETGVHYHPNHTLSQFRCTGAAPLPCTEALYPELLTLPLHTGMTPWDVEVVCHTLTRLIDEDPGLMR